MIPTERQAEAIQLSLSATKPICWLGGVRAGKTVGACMALLAVMAERPGAYFVTGFSWGNIVRNIWPVLVQILDDDHVEFSERKAHPKRITTEYGEIHFFIASDKSAEKAIQGMTLRGGICDEVLLYPRNFLMQLVARFTHDKPFWLMTANKSEPKHWIKTQWIDDDKVIEFNSGPADNPHLSDSAVEWHSSLITGHFRDRMLDNEWSTEYRHVGQPILSTQFLRPKSKDLTFLSIWLDDARGHEGVSGFRNALTGDLYISHVYRFETLRDAELHTQAGHYKICLCNHSRTYSPRMSKTFVADTKVEAMGESLSRWGGKISLAPTLKEEHSAFQYWVWSANSTDTKFTPESTDQTTLAITQAFHVLIGSRKAFSSKGTT